MPKKAEKGHIVIIDDEYLITKVVAQTLRNQGYQTTTYVDGQMAIESFKKILERRNTPDISVILSDINRPDKDGPKTVEEILNLYKEYGEENRKPEIVFMSGGYNENKGARAREISNYPILEKPLLVRPLIEAVNLANDNFYKRISS